MSKKYTAITEREDPTLYVLEIVDPGEHPDWEDGLTKLQLLHMLAEDMGFDLVDTWRNDVP